jgi:hypothetical protein
VKQRLGTGGPWGTGLLILGLTFVATGLGYVLTPIYDLRPPLQWINVSPYFPVRGLAWLWIGIGTYNIWESVTPPQRFLNLLPSIGLLILWSGIFYAYWVVYGVIYDTWTLEWQTGTLYNGFAGVLAAFGWCVNPPRGRPRRNA